MTMPLYALTLCAAANSLRTGELTSEAYTRALLDRIAATDANVLAWAYLDPDGALAAAREADAERRAGAPVGPLAGIGIGVKDIVATSDQPTQQDEESMARGIHARRLVVRLRGRGRAGTSACGDRYADQRLVDTARGVLRRRRFQTDGGRTAIPGRQCVQPDARHARRACAHCRRLRAPGFVPRRSRRHPKPDASDRTTSSARTARRFPLDCDQHRAGTGDAGCARDIARFARRRYPSGARRSLARCAARAPHDHALRGGAADARPAGARARAALREAQRRARRGTRIGRRSLSRRARAARHADRCRNGVVGALRRDRRAAGTGVGAGGTHSDRRPGVLHAVVAARISRRHHPDHGGGQRNAARHAARRDRR
ncbi:MAG: hypothetical protein E6H64_11940 [Betaproteobacteria bacterium]|nr:MAG: hypothetical protein E6H64_11940 [Betaproteobacteria bacterium]